MAKSKIANMMTRIVVIGELEKYEMNEAGNMGKGVLKVGSQNIQFVIFNNEKESAANPHTKATDFSKLYKKGDEVFITGTDARSYSDTKDQYYESVQVWDYRKAQDEKARWVFVYIADVKEIDGDNAVLSFINYKDEEMVFPINLLGAKGEKPSVGDRVKVKGELFSGLKMDYFGDGEYVTERNVVEIQTLNTADEIAADAEESGSDGDMWD